MILAPFKVSEQMREITGNLMTISYVIGLTSGSFSSYILNDWIMYTMKTLPNTSTLISTGVNGTNNITHIHYLSNHYINDYNCLNNTF